MELPFVFKPDTLSDNVALITGGATGIGLGIARRMAMAGASVVLASRKEARCHEVAQSLADEFGVRTLGLGADVRDPAAVEEMVAHALELRGRLDILVNNAAGNFYYPSEALSDNRWRAVMEIDLYGTFHCCRAVFPHFKADGGSIINISMTLQQQGWPGMLPACAAKAGVDALTRTLAVEWARHNIRVNAIAPGPILTEGVRKAFRAGGDFEELLHTVPLGRTGEAEEIGDLAVFMASSAARWMTGEIVTLDGGEHLSPHRGAVGPEVLDKLAARYAARQRRSEDDA